MEDFISFRKMITPVIIVPFYWIFSVFVVISGFVAMATVSFWMGLGQIVIGLVGVRIWAELAMVLFRIYDEVKRPGASVPG